MAILNPYQRARILVVSASVVSFCIFWWAGELFRIPVCPKEEAALLTQPRPAVAVVITGLTFLLCAGIGTALAGAVHFDAGLFAACVGLAGLSCRGGTMRDTLFYGAAHGGLPRTFLFLAAETLILCLLLAAVVAGLEYLRNRGILHGRQAGRPQVPPPSGARRWLAPLVLQTLITALLIPVIARTDLKAQVIAGVGVASFAGTSLSNYLLPGRSVSWCVLIPVLIGAVGYAIAYVNIPPAAHVGSLTDQISALVRPLPLDYASAGSAGAVLGQWMAWRWHRQRATNA